MANYVKQTWTDGASALSAARLGVIENGIFDAHFQPACRVTGAAQSIPNSTLTALAFNNERFDTDTIHDNVTNNTRLTCRTAGIYLIGGNAEWASSPSGNAQIQIFFNNATDIGRVISLSADARAMQVTALYSLAVNDFVELRVLQGSGVAININATANYSPEFWMFRVA